MLRLAALAALATSAVAAGQGCTGKSASLPQAECEAWQEFYDSTGGPGWSVFCNDKRDDPCSCTSGVGDPCKGGPSASAGRRLIEETSAGLPPWHEPDAGVCCQNNHITQMAFALNNLTGPIPKSIKNMTELDNLSACGNKISGEIPDFPESLVYLRLYRNVMTGSIPASMNKLTKIQFLSLGDNLLTGNVPDLSALTKMTDLYLDCNSLTSITNSTNSWHKYTGSCFLNAHGSLLEHCSRHPNGDNTFGCPLPDGAEANCHATCK